MTSINDQELVQTDPNFRSHKNEPDIWRCSLLATHTPPPPPRGNFLHYDFLKVQ